VVTTATGAIAIFSDFWSPYSDLVDEDKEVRKGKTCICSTFLFIETRMKGVILSMIEVLSLVGLASIKQDWWLSMICW
jgi:hypothetical protein